MKRQIYTSMIIISSALSSQMSLGEELHNSSLSPLLISPAQNYQFKKTEFDSQFSFKNQTSTSKTKGSDFKSKSTIKGSEFSASGLYKAPSLPITAGLRADYGSSKLKISNSSSNATNLNLKPSVSVDVTPNITLGMDATFISSETSKDILGKEKTEKDSWTRKSIGAAYHNKDMELGVAFQPKTDDLEGKKISIHGRYSLIPELALGAIVEKEYNSEVNDSDKDSIKTSLSVETTPIKDLTLAGIYSYKGDHAKSNELANTNNSSQHSFYAAADYSVSRAIKVGGFMDKRIVDRSTSTSEFEKDDLTLGIRGSFAF